MSRVDKPISVKKSIIPDSSMVVALNNRTWKVTRNFFAPSALMTEAGDYLLQENGDRIYLDQ